MSGFLPLAGANRGHGYNILGEALGAEIARAASFHLSEEGYDVDVASDGQQGLRIFQEKLHCSRNQQSVGINKGAAPLR